MASGYLITFLSRGVGHLDLSWRRVRLVPTVAFPVASAGEPLSQQPGTRPVSTEAVLTLIFSAVVAISTVVYAVLTWRLVEETRNMRAAQTDPSIGIHIEPSPAEGQLFMLVVQNHGMGPAYGVRFDVDAKQDSADRPLAFLRNASGLAYMAPGQKIVAFFGSSFDLLKRADKGCANVRVTYRKPNGADTTSEFILDPGRFEGMPLIGGNHSRRLADSVEDITKTLKQIVSASRLQVTTQTREAEQQEHQAFVERATARHQSQADSRRGPPSAPPQPTPPHHLNSA